MTNTFTAERRLPLSNLDSRNHEEWKSTEEKKLAEEKLEVLSESFRKTIEALGEDSKRDGLQNTPERAAKTLCFLTKGYEQNIQGESVICMLVITILYNEHHNIIIISN